MTFVIKRVNSLEQAHRADPKRNKRSQGAGELHRRGDREKIAAEGIIIFAGWRYGENLAPSVANIESLRGLLVARQLDAGKEAGAVRGP